MKRLAKTFISFPAPLCLGFVLVSALALLTAPCRAQQSLAGHEHYVSSLAFRPDGRQLASGGEDKTIKLWNAAGK